jgi:hypothetical protein
LIQGSIADNTHKSYNIGLKSFENFREYMHYDKQWPPSVQQIQEYIAYLSHNGYAYSTASCHVSAISFSCKINGRADPTRSFVVQKMLTGMKRLNKRSDARRPINLSLLNKFQIV